MENVQSIKGLISIIVPVYNAEKYIETCINSIRNQTYSKLEIILINDGSTDKSGDICQKYAKLDSRIKYIEEPNHGQGYARNYGIEISTGEFIGFVDADDQLELDMYEVLYSAIVKYKADFAGCDHSNIIDGKVIYRRAPKLGCEKKIFSKQEALSEFSTGENIAWGVWDKIFRKTSLKDTRFPNERIHGEDTLFLLDFIKKNRVFCCLKLGKYYHNDSNNDSYTKKKWSKSNLGLIKFYGELYNTMKNYHIEGRINQVAARYYENLLSSYIRCKKNKYTFEANYIRDLMINDYNAIKNAPLLKCRFKIDISVCILLPNLGPKLNFWYK